MLSKRLQTTLHLTKFCSILSYYSWYNIAQVRALCNIVQEPSENITQEKILFIVVLILLGKHYTVKNLVQFCPRASRKHYSGINPVQFSLNTFGKRFYRYKPCAMLSRSLQKTFHIKKSCSIMS